MQLSVSVCSAKAAETWKEMIRAFRFLRLRALCPRWVETTRSSRGGHGSALRAMSILGTAGLLLRTSKASAASEEEVVKLMRRVVERQGGSDLAEEFQAGLAVLQQIDQAGKLMKI